MWQYLLRRLAYVIPTLLVISVIIFGLSKQTAGDPVLTQMLENNESNASNSLSEDVYLSSAKNLGLDKPLFYFTLTSQAFPYDFYKIIKKDQRTASENLIKRYGNWIQIKAFHQAIKDNLYILPLQDSLGFNNNLQQLLIQDDDEKILFLLHQLNDKAHATGVFNAEMVLLKQRYEAIINKSTRSKLFIPAFYAYGLDNQYHQWISHFFKGNFGIAKNGQRVVEKIRIPLSITLSMSLPALFIAYLIGVPIGIFTAAKRQKRAGKWATKMIFALYSLPTFWIALMAIRFLTTPEFGLKFFPSAGLINLNGTFSIANYLMANVSRFILPILCMVIHPIAYIARLTQGAILDNLSQDYVRTARAKGLTEWKILYQHVLKNALFPLITLLGVLFPMLISGSFVIEYVFNIKGMGRVAFDAIGEQDWQVVYTVLMLSAILVLLGTLLSDILYKWANPRVTIK